MRWAPKLFASIEFVSLSQRDSAEPFLPLRVWAVRELFT